MRANADSGFGKTPCSVVVPDSRFLPLPFTTVLRTEMTSRDRTKSAATPVQDARCVRGASVRQRTERLQQVVQSDQSQQSSILMDYEHKVLAAPPELPQRVQIAK
jgi:hypothetical protein